jgi:membrane-bound serine protease (ClpP class)
MIGHRKIMPLRETLLSFVATPDRAFLTLLFGLLLIYREMLAPGRIIPGVLGGVAFFAAAHALIEWGPTAISLVLLAAAGVLAWIQARGPRRYWVPGVCAAACMFAGSRLLLPPPNRISMAVVSLTIPFTAVTVYLLTMAVRARRNKRQA